MPTHQLSVNGPHDLKPVYTVIRRVADGYAWNGADFEVPDNANWQTYAIAFENKGLGMYTLQTPIGTLPIGGDYAFNIYERAGSEPSPSDVKVQNRTFHNWGSEATGSEIGDTPTDHNTGGTDALRYVDSAGNGIDGAIIRAYLADEFTASASTAPIRGQSSTLADGRWSKPIIRDATLDYVFTFHAGGFQSAVKEVPGEEAD